LFRSINLETCCGWTPVAIDIAVDGLQLILTLKCTICTTQFTQRVGLEELDSAAEPWERRRTIRQATNCTIEVSSGDALINVKVIDISTGGIGIITKSPLHVGEVVVVRAGDTAYQGRVQHCRDLGGEFRIGLKCSFL
jgi:hypothetical protein